MADIRLSSAKALGDKDLLNATSPAVLRFELAANMATLDGTVCPNGDDTSRHSIHVDRYPAGAEVGADGEAMPRDASAFAIARMGLRCAHYHAAAVDLEERLNRWLTMGGWVIATPPPRTGVDFPGIESVWAGRAGEDVDFVIIVEGGRIKALNEISGIVGGLFKAMMDEFITTKRCTPSSEPPSERAQKWLRNRRWEGAQLPAR
ncbi:hypothetical protein LTR03_017918 [Friedmanniomyces endolithicus]|nr:hypothetical protein LTR03_017918 [Friedmanniomyces endolithicus]